MVRDDMRYLMGKHSSQAIFVAADAKNARKDKNLAAGQEVSFPQSLPV